MTTTKRVVRVTYAVRVLTDEGRLVEAEICRPYDSPRKAFMEGYASPEAAEADILANEEDLRDYEFVVLRVVTLK